MGLDGSKTSARPDYDDLSHYAFYRELQKLARHSSPLVDYGIPCPLLQRWECTKLRANAVSARSRRLSKAPPGYTGQLSSKGHKRRG